MQVLRVAGGARLDGTVEVVGAKNSVLKLMAAALLAPGSTTIGNLPAISDVTIMRQLLEGMGCEALESKDGAVDRVTITVPERLDPEAPYELVRKIRGSICVLGPLIARTGGAKVALPGGDAIGTRPLDMHFAGLERMGVDIRVEHGYVIAEARDLRGASIWLDFPSVGATENIMTAAVLAKGTTVIDNAAREPEIVDLCRLLVAMGAQIDGIGSSTLEITGVEALRPATHDAVADRIVAGTWAMAALATQGDITVRGAQRRPPEDRAGQGGAGGRRGRGARRRLPGRHGPPAAQLRRRDAALPGARDGPAAAGHRGAVSGRRHGDDHREPVRGAVHVLRRDLPDGRRRPYRRSPRRGTRTAALSGAPVRATDIRAGVGLVIAGLVADGITEVAEIHHIDRGYVRFEEQLRNLGADVQRVDSTTFGA